MELQSGSGIKEAVPVVSIAEMTGCGVLDQRFPGSFSTQSPKLVPEVAGTTACVLGPRRVHQPFDS